MKTFNQYINEGYMERVKQEADLISKKLHSKKPSDQELINMISNKHGEKQIGGKALKDFVKDIKKELSASGVFKRVGAQHRSDKSRVKKEESNALLRKIAYDIEDAAGQSFPDGDPFDVLIRKPWARNYQDGNLIDLLNSAAKKYLGVKDYHTYLANMWDDIKKDNPNPKDSAYHLVKGKNPWR